MLLSLSDRWLAVCRSRRNRETSTAVILQFRGTDHVNPHVHLKGAHTADVLVLEEGDVAD